MEATFDCRLPCQPLPWMYPKLHAYFIQGDGRFPVCTFPSRNAHNLIPISLTSRINPISATRDACCPPLSHLHLDSWRLQVYQRSLLLNWHPSTQLLPFHIFYRWISYPTTAQLSQSDWNMQAKWTVILTVYEGIAYIEHQSIGNLMQNIKSATFVDNAGSWAIFIALFHLEMH